MLRRLVIGLLAAFTIAAINVVPAIAQGSGQGLEISPPLVELKTDPGKTVHFAIRLRNVTTGPLVAQPLINDFVAEGENGQPKIILDQNTESTQYSLKSWVQTIPSATIQPQELKTLDITLVVPQNASPGGHYGVIRFTAVPPGMENTGVSLSASIGSLVLVNVSGAVTENLSVKDFFPARNNNKTSIFQKGPIDFVERLSNGGNIHVKPTGTIRVTNMLGKEVAVMPLNPLGGNVLPQSVRRFQQTFNKPRLFGRYSAQLTIQYGNNKSITTSTNFWVIPYNLIAAILGILIIILVLIRIGLARYKKSILKKAKQNNSPKNDQE